MGDQPQWSPPVMGGMTPRPGITVHAVPRAAMEPARNGRDDRPFEQPHPAEAREPQWSPPVMGGMTMQHSVTVPAVRVAAMEPARNGRDDQHHPHRLAVHRLAAMEPARNGRDDSGSFWIWGANTMPPQWSPPVMGGMTGASGTDPFGNAVPQWSPPVMGGMTLARATGLHRVTVPQWSPPVMGGMTGH